LLLLSASAQGEQQESSSDAQEIHGERDSTERGFFDAVTNRLATVRSAAL
jgi:hypothetical protein